MAKKITINTLCSGSEGYYTRIVTGEFYESNGLQFCIHWSEDNRQVIASELSTGMIVGTVTRYHNKAPKQALLSRVDSLAKDGSLKKPIDDCGASLNTKRAELLERLKFFPSFPINEPVKSNNNR
jgi:hypothetical protein